MSIVDRFLGRETTDDLQPPSDALESDVDELFEMIANQRRRNIIDIVGDLDDGDFRTLSNLADELAFIENDEFDSIRDVDRQARKRVYVSLYQTHLSKMDEAGLVEYQDVRDEDTEEVLHRRVIPTEKTRSAQRVIRKGYVEVSGGGAWSR